MCYNLTLNIGPSNAGKTHAGIIPQMFDIIKEKRAFVAIDAKNEILPNVGNMLAENDYRIFTLNLRDTLQSHFWNPLDLPYQLFKNNEMEECYHILDDLASDIFLNSNDFWESSAKDLFIGLCLLLFSEATDVSQINMSSIYYLAVNGFRKYAGSNYIQEYLNLKNEKFSLLASTILTTLEAGEDTRKSILSTLYQSLRDFTASNTVINILSGKGISIEDITKEKTALFLMYEDENPQNARMINVFLMQIYRTLISKRSQNPKKYAYYSFFLDDFLSLPKLTKIDEVILGCKGRKITISFGINNIELLKKKYGEETTAALLANADCINIFYDIMRNYDKYFTNHDYQEALSFLCSGKMLKIALKGIEQINVEDILSQGKKAQYHYTFQNQRTEEPIYFDFVDLVKQLKLEEYKTHMETVAKNVLRSEDSSIEGILGSYLI